MEELERDESESVPDDQANSDEEDNVEVRDEDSECEHEFESELLEDQNLDVDPPPNKKIKFIDPFFRSES